MIFKKIYLLFLLVFALHPLYGAHIIGGDVTYRCVSVNATQKRTRFEINFTMYRDSKGGGANFDIDAEFGLFKSSGNNVWTYVKSFNASPKDIEPVGYDNPCIIIPPNIGVEKAVYEFEVDIDWGTEVYQIAYQRCCRNGTITNIINPGSTGAVFSVEIYADAISSCNNSPVFKNFPPIVICNGEPLRFDHSATDAEGDQLVYEFCAPLASGGTDGESGVGDPTSCTGVRPAAIRCIPPYAEAQFVLPMFSSINPIGGFPQVSIDPGTGFISGEPNVTGQYVVGVCVKEYRDGKQIGSIRRDFQFNVTVCQIAVSANIAPDFDRISTGYVEFNQTGEDFYFKSCGSNFIPFLNKSTVERNIQGYKWRLIQGNVVDSFTTKDLDYTFQKTGRYTGQMILNPNLSDCSDTAKLIIDILPAVAADFSFAYDTCIAGPVLFEDKSTSGAGNITQWSWTFETDTSIVLQNPSFEFTSPGVKKINLKAADGNGCTNVIEKNIIYQPVPALIVVEPTQFTGCVPASIQFNNLSYPIDDTYTLEWDFGDGNKDDNISPRHTYNDTGIFDVSLTITSPIGCKTKAAYPQWIEILESPLADFVYAPEVLTNFNKTALFTNLSERQKSVVWNFNNLGISFENNPSFSFPDTGQYLVTLVAIHENGCTDTAKAKLDVMPVVTLQMPNAFTPNNDGLNDDFRGYGFLDGLINYRMSIWNRWGEQIFETGDPYIGWNGEINNDGQMSPQGVYIYQVDYISPRGEEKKLRGHVTLVR
ncbi:MAG: gliding motility-associated C-terminal domain-containing protein [Saprospiraceae bacterium]|nr:gliding motility-associated C-terminal domain-containing protein [Saprospiraceae bacterium]